MKPGREQVEARALAARIVDEQTAKVVRFADEEGIAVDPSPPGRVPRFIEHPMEDPGGPIALVHLLRDELIDIEERHLRFYPWKWPPDEKVETCTTAP